MSIATAASYPLDSKPHEQQIRECIDNLRGILGSIIDQIFTVALIGYLVVGTGSFLFHSTLKCKCPSRVMLIMSIATAASYPLDSKPHEQQIRECIDNLRGILGWLPSSRNRELPVSLDPQMQVSLQGYVIPLPTPRFE
jgi:hypothetical protein